MALKLDRRRHPVRPDLAARAYQGKVEAARFVDGTKRTVIADRLAFRAHPRLDAGIDTEALYGEEITVFEETPDGWAWGQLSTDGYVGWFSTGGIGAHIGWSHRVSALRTFRYPGPDLKHPPLGALSLGSRVRAERETVTRGLVYAELADGSFVVAKHLTPMDRLIDDWVTVAEQFLETPYLWGGRSSLGLDCSALVQLAAAEAGLAVPRDSDMQAAEAGTAVFPDDLDALMRGDLVFWTGHVGIVQGPNRMLHANGYTMTVASEPLKAAVDRILASEFGAVTGVRRLG
ncbi:MAG: C40 family peptidase [Roseibium sp.]|nr:C40 family peptidase [Roseibium sp.]